MHAWCIVKICELSWVVCYITIFSLQRFDGNKTANSLVLVGIVRKSIRFLLPKTRKWTHATGRAIVITLITRFQVADAYARHRIAQVSAMCVCVSCLSLHKYQLCTVTWGNLVRKTQSAWMEDVMSLPATWFQVMQFSSAPVNCVLCPWRVILYISLI